MSEDGMMSIVPPRGFIWGEAIEGLESDWIFGGVRVVGDRALIESVAPENLCGEVRGPDLQQSVSDNPTLHNTMHNTIFNEKFPSVKRMNVNRRRGGLFETKSKFIYH